MRLYDGTRQYGGVGLSFLFKTSVTLRAFNLADKRYYTTAYYTATQWFAGERRRVELTLNHRF